MNWLDKLAEWLPVPDNLFDLTWTLIGIQLGATFGKINQKGMGIDEYIKDHGKFKGWTRFVVERVLHFLHHYWLGLLLIIYYPQHQTPELMWLGLGLFLEDSFYHTQDFLRAKLGKLKIEKEQNVS